MLSAGSGHASDKVAAAAAIEDRPADVISEVEMLDEFRGRPTGSGQRLP